MVGRRVDGIRCPMGKHPSISTGDMTRSRCILSMSSCLTARDPDKIPIFLTVSCAHDIRTFHHVVGTYVYNVVGNI